MDSHFEPAIEDLVQWEFGKSRLSPFFIKKQILKPYSKVVSDSDYLLGLILGAPRQIGRDRRLRYPGFLRKLTNRHAPLGQQATQHEFELKLTQ